VLASLLTSALASTALRARALTPVPSAPGAPGAPTNPRPPIIIAHRGASGHRPEHTLAAYELAIAQGADFIEPDVVVTKDGVLVARHEHRLDETTDAAARFPTRRTTKRFGGDSATGWFVEDFTLAELRTLRARERLQGRSHAYDGRFAIPTLDEVFSLAARKGREVGRSIGVYPETKHPSYFASIGLPLEERLIEALRQHGLDHRDAPVFIQSFEVENLRRLRSMTTVRLIQLIDERGGPVDLAIRGDTTSYRTMTTPEGLREIARYADGVGANKVLIVPANARDSSLTRSPLVDEAHAAGLVVHAWTFRSDSAFLAPVYAGDPGAEYRLFARLGVDGVFTDFPDAAVRALRPAGGAPR
jgi:glycerophosphoryl diester phosphodiesterase